MRIVGHARRKAVREAYQVLANPDLRAEYDAHLPPRRRDARRAKGRRKGTWAPWIL